ncbi:hypothetical protein CONPUDRAFT_48136, partial [Coniophora puteana RWD-64-598 SS2]
QLPSWIDISSFADEELFSLFDKSERRLSESTYFICTSVRQIASDAVMKSGIQDSEPLTMDLVRASSHIPVPAVLRVLRAGSRQAVVMEYITGETVENCWGKLGLWQRLRVVWSIRSYIQQLRRILVSNTHQGTHFPGPIGDEPRLCYASFLVTLSMANLFLKGGGPFHSYDELTQWFNHKVEATRRFSGALPPELSFDSSFPLVLTHFDISPRNVIVDDNSRVWLIDWEHAGFYPQWFEYSALYNGWTLGGRWKRWMVGFMAGFYERQANFISKIGWAIHTGHFV